MCSRVFLKRDGCCPSFSIFPVSKSSLKEEAVQNILAHMHMILKLYRSFPFPHTATPPVCSKMIKVPTLDLLFCSPTLPDHILAFLRLAFMLSSHTAASLSSP